MFQRAAGGSFCGQIWAEIVKFPPAPPPEFSHSLFSHGIADEQEHWSVEFHDAAGNVALLLCVPVLLKITTSFRSRHLFPDPLTSA